MASIDKGTWNPQNFVNTKDSWTGTGTRMLVGASPTVGDVKRIGGGIWGGAKAVGKGIWKGISGTIGGQNSFNPSGTQLDQTVADRDRNAALQSRGNQSYLLGQLRNQIQGQGPTVAGQQAQQGIAQAMANAGHMAANARGVSRGLAQRSALYSGMQAQQQANRDAALMRAQEQLSAQEQYGGVVGQQRTGDIQTRQLSLDAAKANQDADLQAQGYKTTISNENATRAQKGAGALINSIGGAVKGLFSDVRVKEDVEPITPGEVAPVSTFAQQLRDSLTRKPVTVQYPANTGAALYGEQAGIGAHLAEQQRSTADANTSNAGMDTSGNGPSAGGVWGAIGGGLEAYGNGLISDERSKEALAPLTPYMFRYKPEFAAALASQAASEATPRTQDAVRDVAYEDARAPREGIMAQDLERSPQGSKAVDNSGPVKAIKMKRSLGFLLANQAGLNKRLAALEGRA